MTRHQPDDGDSTVGHRTLPHTADLIVAAWAPTLEQCLAEAVAALTDSYVDTSHATPKGRQGFRIAVTVPEQMLVALLEEAVYLLDAQGVVVVSTHIEQSRGSELSGWFDIATVEPTALIGSVPKGIGLSGLNLRQDNAGWHCTVTIDV